jgi:SPX domain protein involved in polyphosphate accumulation
MGVLSHPQLHIADCLRSLPRNQVPEWSSAYINYKGLKKLIKAAVDNVKTGKDIDLSGEVAR